MAVQKEKKMYSLILNKIFCKLIDYYWSFCSNSHHLWIMAMDSQSLSVSCLVPPPFHPISNSQWDPPKHKVFVKTRLLKNLPIVLKIKVKYLSMMEKKPLVIWPWLSLQTLVLSQCPNTCHPLNTSFYLTFSMTLIFFFWLKYPSLHQNRGKLILVPQTQLMLYPSCEDSKTSPRQN